MTRFGTLFDNILRPIPQLVRFPVIGLVLPIARIFLGSGVLSSYLPGVTNSSLLGKQKKMWKKRRLDQTKNSTARLVRKKPSSKLDQAPEKTHLRVKHQNRVDAAVRALFKQLGSKVTPATKKWEKGFASTLTTVQRYHPNVAKSTLKDAFVRALGNAERSATPGKPGVKSALTNFEEDELVKWVNWCRKKQLTPTLDELRGKVIDICEARGVERDISESWAYKFKTRHDITLRAARTKEQARANLEAVEVAIFFVLLEILESENPCDVVCVFFLYMLGIVYDCFFCVVTKNLSIVIVCRLANHSLVVVAVHG